MNATLLLQSALAGITNGFVYALIAIGIAVIFRGTRIINAMQGEFALIGGMVAYLVLERLGLALPLAAHNSAVNELPQNFGSRRAAAKRH